MPASFSGAAAGQKSDELLIRRQAMSGEEFGTRESWAHHLGERMTYIRCIDPALAKPLLLKREEAEQPIDQLPDDLDPPGPPCPDLGRNQIKYRDSEPFQVTSKPKVEIRTIGEQCGDWQVMLGVTNQLAVFAIDSRQVAGNFSQPDHGEPRRIDDRLNVSFLQFGSGASIEMKAREDVRKVFDNARSVHVA